MTEVKRTLLGWLLIFSLTPALGEAVEWTLHLVGHRDFAHSSKPDHRPGPEHGCTPVLHSCGCHAGLSGSVARPGADAEPLRPSGWRRDASTGRHGYDLEPPPHRPPLA